MPILGLLTNKYVVVGGIVLVAAVAAYLWVYHSGFAAATVVATATALQRTAAAQKAKAEVKANDQAAMDADSYNRDRPGH